ncbi:MAG: ABC transporter ATP-binding protein [Miltoncostaeaceae bacterium]
MSDREPHGHRLEATALHLAYDGVRVVHGVDLAVAPARITAIVGANASGKSTLLRGLARLLKPAGRGVTLDGSDIHRLPTRSVARILGLLPQEPRAPEGITVGDLVARGRHPHRGALGRWSAADEAAVHEALAATGTAGLTGRRVDALSGGQRQRAWIAMALAQDPAVLMLDEPTSFLDLTHQLDVLELLRALNRTRGTTVVMVLHELNLAARYADRIVVMAAGRAVAAGAPAEVMTPAVIRDAFALEARVVDDPVAGTPMIVPVGRAAAPA